MPEFSTLFLTLPNKNIKHQDDLIVLKCSTIFGDD